MVAARRPPVDAFAWESFGEDWVTDVIKQLKIKDARVIRRPTANCPT
jgi:phosphoserine aminotransferase